MKHIRTAVAVALALLVALGIALLIRDRHARTTASASRAHGAANVVADTSRKVRDFPRNTGFQVTPPEVSASVDPEAPPHRFDTWLNAEAAAMARLRGIRISINYTDASFAHMLADFRERYGIELLVDGDVDISNKTITFKVEELAADQALDLILKMADLALSVSESGELWIVTKEDRLKHLPAQFADIQRLIQMSDRIRREGALDPHAAANAAVLEALRKPVASWSFGGGSMYDAIDSFVETARVNVVISASLRKGQGEDLNSPIPGGVLAGSTGEEALAGLLGPREFAWYTQNGCVLIDSQERVREREERLAAQEAERRAIAAAEAELLGRTVAFGGKGLAVREVAELLGQALGVPVEVDPPTWRLAARLTFDDVARPASDIVSALKKSAPVIVAWRDGTLWFLSPKGVQ